MLSPACLAVCTSMQAGRLLIATPEGFVASTSLAGCEALGFNRIMEYWLDSLTDFWLRRPLTLTIPLLLLIVVGYFEKSLIRTTCGGLDLGSNPL